MLDAGSATALSRDLIESSIGSFGQFYRLEKPFVKLGLDPRASHIRNRINLQILTMRIRNLHIRRMRRKNHILKLDRMLRQRVHKIDVELAQEQRVILQNNHDDSQRSLVELLQCLGAGLSGDHVLLDEGEAGDEEFFDFGPLLDLLLLLDVLGFGLFLELVVEGGGSCFDEVGHEVAVGDEFEPREGEGWVLVRVHFQE